MEPDLSVVIPLYNEAPCLDELHRRLTAVLEGLGRPWEIVYVNDGSVDETPRILDALAAADPRVRPVHFSRNFGQHPAVYAGFAHARGSTLVTLDGDLQNPPEEIPNLLAEIEKGYDAVTGVREHRHDSILRRIPSRIVNWMIRRLTRVPLRDYGCLLRAYRRPVIDLLLSCPEQTVYFTALLAWLGPRIGEVEVRHAPRAAGRSRYSILRLVTQNFDLLTGYSILPIQLISLAGIAIAGLGFLVGLVLLFVALLEPSVGRWILLAFAAASTAFGILLVALGFIGEYIGRILIEVKGRPRYVLREQVRPPSSGPPT